jgi:CRISPR-associated protein Cas1
LTHEIPKKTMQSLYLTRRGTTLRRKNRSLLVTIRTEKRKNQPLLELEPHLLESICLIGEVHITSNALHYCLDQGISISWFLSNGRFLARTHPSQARSADLRIAQYRQCTDPKAGFGQAKNIIHAKIHNSLSVLSGIRSNRPQNPLLSQALADLQASQKACAQAKTMEQLLGIEGSSARRYFEAWGTTLSEAFSFTGRKRRPPPDPVNALLSFGYVILTHRLSGLLEARGLDPALGCLHSIRPGRPSLALDLLEEFRAPVIDRMVHKACNMRRFRTDHFRPDEAEENGVRLTDEGLKIFFRIWAKTMRSTLREEGQENPSVEEALRRQVDRYAMAVRGQTPYKPFQFAR